MWSMRTTIRSAVHPAFAFGTKGLTNGAAQRPNQDFELARGVLGAQIKGCLRFAV